jgi:hypothetical protein
LLEKKMKYLGVILAVLALGSCEQPRLFDDEAALIWSKKPEVQLREQSATYSFERGDGSWVAISTAKMTETEIGLMYSGGEVLKSGFITYPGGKVVTSIEDAIKICSKLEGAKYKKSEQVGSSNGG